MIFFIILLFFRFFLDWQLGAKFQIGQRIKLNYCLFNQPLYTQDKQIFYYQNHFQKLKITAPIEPQFDFGDCLQIIGKIEECSKLSRAKLCLINLQILPFQENSNPKFLSYRFLKRLRLVRKELSKVFLENLPYPEADLLNGIVLGVKQKLDPEFYQQLRQTGTLHIIVASGYNLSVTGKRPVEYLAYFFGRKPAILIGLVLIWLYVGIVGFESPIIRAAIMLSFLFLAQLLGKKYHQWRAFIFAIWLMLMIKPDLIVSISFQLSVAALLGIMLGGRMFGRLKNIPVIGEVLAETLSAQLMVAPIIIWHFGSLSWLAPITNALILPLIPVIMSLGLIGLLLGRIVLWAIYPLLWWSIFIVEKFSG